MSEWQSATADTPAGQASVPSASSTQVMAANAGRLETTICNDSDTPVYISLGVAAQSQGGILLGAAGGSYTTGSFTGQINAFHNGSGAKLLAYVEI